MDRVYLNALFDLAMEEAISGDAWFLPEAFAVLFIVLDLAHCADPQWRFMFPRASKSFPVHQEIRDYAIMEPGVDSVSPR